jgi:hypothetical protein
MNINIKISVNTDPPLLELKKVFRVDCDVSNIAVPHLLHQAFKIIYTV